MKRRYDGVHAYIFSERQAPFKALETFVFKYMGAPALPQTYDPKEVSDTYVGTSTVEI